MRRSNVFRSLVFRCLQKFGIQVSSNVLGTARRRAQLLNEALSKCQLLTNIEQVLDSNNDRLVHLTGTLTTDKPLEDSQFGVSVRAVRLRRKVEMYQWVEHRRTQEYGEYGGIRKYKVICDYTKEWRENLVYSIFFDKESHDNPSTFPINDDEWKAQQTTVGSFQFSSALIELVSDWKRVRLSHTHELEREGVKIHDNYIYRSCDDPWLPQVGNVRIKYDSAGMSDSTDPIDVSIIARQSPGGQLTKYYSTNLRKELLYLHFGMESCEEMLDKEYISNDITTWLCRGIGWCLSFIGLLILTNSERCLDFSVIKVVINLFLASFVTLFSIAMASMDWNSFYCKVIKQKPKSN